MVLVRWAAAEDLRKRSARRGGFAQQIGRFIILRFGGNELSLGGVVVLTCVSYRQAGNPLVNRRRLSIGRRVAVCRFRRSLMARASIPLQIIGTASVSEKPAIRGAFMLTKVW